MSGVLHSDGVGEENSHGLGRVIHMVFGIYQSMH
jgi:hypothetical protein